MAAVTAGRWDDANRLGRLSTTLDFASEAVRSIASDNGIGMESAESPGDGVAFLSEKVVAETAMLLLCASAVEHLDEGIHDRVHSLAAALVPHARSDAVLAAICLDPGLARDHAVAHIILSRLGYPDRDVDYLLSKSLSLGPDFGPERLPHRLLEQEWLARVWPVNETPPRTGALRQSMLGKSLDALGSGRLEIYALTHAVMYATDFGTRRIALPRRVSAVAADADAALAYCLDGDDYDLSAEVLLTWPMLGIAWSPASIFALSLLADMEDNIGFLPGPEYDPSQYKILPDHERKRFVLATSYHTVYVAGFLWACSLREGCSPPPAVRSARSSNGAASALILLADANPVPCRWRHAFDALTPAQQDSIATLVLGIVLRRATARGDLGLIRKALELALVHQLFNGPAPVQAAALLRRSKALWVASGIQRPSAARSQQASGKPDFS